MLITFKRRQTIDENGLASTVTALEGKKEWAMRPFIIILLSLIVSGCATAVPSVKPPQSGSTIGASLNVVTPARESIQSSATTILVENAQPAPSKEIIGREAQNVASKASLIQTEEPKLAIAADDSTNTGQGLVAANKEIERLKTQLADAQSTSFRWLITSIIVAVAVCVGAGFALGNTRLSVSAGLGGAAGVVLCIVAGTVWRWADAILLSLGIFVGVAALLVGVFVFIDWRKNGANALREKDK